MGTVEVEDRYGEPIEVPAGADPNRPVSVNNPEPKAILGQPDLEQGLANHDSASPSADEQKELAKAQEAAFETVETERKEADEDAVVRDQDEGGDPAATEEPSGNASREDWAAYAKTKGATDEDLADLKRDEIRDKYGSSS